MLEKRTPALAGAGAAGCQPGGDSLQLTENLSETLERIAADDRRWFKRHPRKRWRIRPPLPGEYPCGPVMAVRQVAPGARLRFAMFTDVLPGLTDRGLEYFIRAVIPPDHARLIDQLKAALARMAE